MSDTSLQPEENVEEASIDAETPVVPEDETPEPQEELLGESPKPDVKKVKPKAAKKTTPAQASAQAVDALVTTITSMAESLQTLSNTVDALSTKVATPPAPIATETTHEEPPVIEEVHGVEEKSGTIRSVALSSFGTLASFVGVGLVAAAAMRTSFDSVAVLLAVIGGVLFAVNGLVIDRDKTVEGLRNHGIHSAMVLLAVAGIGLLVGGIQRFGEDPHRAAILLPIGAALFVVATAWKMRDRLASEHLVWMAGVGVWVCLFLGVGLNQVAGNIDPHEPAKANATQHGTTGETVSHEPTTTTIAGGHSEESGIAVADEHGAATDAAHEGAALQGAATGHEETTTTTAAVTQAHSEDPNQSAINEAVQAGQAAAEEHH